VGLLKLTKHDVAISTAQLKSVDNQLVLAGAANKAFRAGRLFEYAN